MATENQNGATREGMGEPGQHEASQVQELEKKLAEAERKRKRLRRQLDEVLAQARALAEEKERLLSSTSWRITAPLRRIRVWLGAPEEIRRENVPVPVLGSGESAGKEGVSEDPGLPIRLPDDVVVTTVDKASKQNETCVLARPEKMLEGLVPPESGLKEAGCTERGRIAYIGSSELFQELGYEVDVVRLAEADWEEQLRAWQFDFLLVETVWHAEGAGWRNSLAQDGRGTGVIRSLFEQARMLGIPTVVWYRCDPEDVGDFAWLAPLADRSYAISDRVAKALVDVSGKAVPVLGPFIQPRLHNPFRTWEQLQSPENGGKVLFDGWLDLAEGAASDPLVLAFKDQGLVVAESNWEFGGPRLGDHPEFVGNALGCLTPVGKAALTRMLGAEIFRTSPLLPEWKKVTMMLRAIATGALVAESGPAGSCRWADLPIRGDAEEVARRLRHLFSDPLERARTHHLALREVLNGNCLADRLDRIASDLGLDRKFGKPMPRVACLLVTMRPDFLPGCIERFRRDRYPNKELVIVLHGRDMSLRDAKALVRDGEPISVYQCSRQLGLGSCLNFAAGQSDAEYWAKIDDDDIYGPNYLSDMMAWARLLDIDIAGKTVGFTYLDGEDEVRFDPACAAGRSWQYRRPGRGERLRIAGGSLAGKRSVLEDVPFSDRRRKGSDSDFIRRSEAAGYGFHALDFFNFAVFRSGISGFHTWNLDVEYVKSRTVLAGGYSDLERTVFV